MNGFIEIVSGTLGGGKTAVAVERIYAHLKRGGYVYTNIEVYSDKIGERLRSEGYEFDSTRLVILEGSARDYPSRICRGTAESLVMLVVDEAGLDLNAKDHQKTDRTFLAFNTMARKLDIYLIYISQSALDVDNQIRRKAEIVTVCRNMKKVKIWGIIPFPLPFYFRVRFDNTHGKPQKLDSECVMRPSSWGLYNSDAMVGEIASQWREIACVKGAPLKRVTGHAEKRFDFWVELIVILCSSFCVSF